MTSIRMPHELPYIIDTTRQDPQTFKYRWINHPTLPDGTEINSPNVHYPDPYRTRIEYYTENSRGSRSLWKDFEHYKKSSSSYTEPTVKHTHYTSQYIAVWPNSTNICGYREIDDRFAGWPHTKSKDLPIWDLPEFYSPLLLDGHFIGLPSSWESLKQSALNVMLPQVKSDLSLLNSLVELKDFKSLPRTLIGLRDLAVKGKRTLRSILRGAADGYLQNAFNIQPLLSDISGIYTALLRHEARINALVTRSAKAQKRYFRYFFVENSDVNDTSSHGISSEFTADTIGTTEVERWVFNEPTKFHAVIEYNFCFTQYQLEHARVLALLDNLGVNLNPSIIWNAIPWSFVVDWVFGVSRWLNQFTIANMAPVINIRRCSFSVLRSRRIVTNHSICNDSHLLSPPKVPSPVVFETAYRRIVGLPSSSSIISGGLNLKEFSLGAALVLSRRRRRKR